MQLWIHQQQLKKHNKMSIIRLICSFSSTWKIKLYHTISQHSIEPYIHTNTHVSYENDLISFQCLHTSQAHAFIALYLAKKIPCCKIVFDTIFVEFLFAARKKLNIQTSKMCIREILWAFDSMNGLCNVMSHKLKKNFLSNCLLKHFTFLIISTKNL